MLGIDEILGAEPATDIGRHEPHRRRSNAERAGGVVAGGVNALARDIGRVSAVIRIPKADDASRLDRVGDDPVIVELKLDDMRGRSESRVDRGGIAGPPIEADIARDLVRNLGSP